MSQTRPPTAPAKAETAPSSEPGTGGASIIWVIAVCRFAEAVAMGMLVPILPLFLTKLDAGGSPALGDWGQITSDWTAEERTALLFSLTGFSMAGIQLLSGRLSDALDMRKPFILIGLLGGAFCSASYTLLESFVGLLGVRILQGTFMGLTFPPLMAIIAHHAPVGRGGRSLGIYSTIRLLGFAGGPLLGAWISDRWNHEAAFATSSALLVISIFTVGQFVPEHKDGLERDAAGRRTVLPRVPFDLRLLGSTIFLMMVGISAMISLFPTYQREFDASEAELGFLFSAFIGTRFLLQYPLGLLGDRHDKKWVLIAALVLLIPSIALQGYIRNLGDLLVLRVLLGVGAAAVSVSVNGIAAERSEPGNRARAMGINTFSFSLGVACGPLLTGFVADTRVAFTIPALAGILLLALVLFRVPSDRRHRETTAADVTAEHFA